MHLATGMLHVSCDSLRSALEEFSAAERIQSFITGEHSLSGQVTGWTIATQARLGMLDEARTARANVPAERSRFGEIRNASAVIHLAEGDPTAALDSLQVVLDGGAPVLHDFSLVESHLLAARGYVELDDRRAANDSVERALALAEPDRLVFPFVMTGSRDLLEAIPRHTTAHTAVLIDILDVMRGSSIGPRDRPVVPPIQDLTEMELRVLRFLPTNLSRREIARELYLSVHTVNTHVRNIYTKLEAGDRSTALKRARELRLLSSATSR
jgi:LuxR family maltose regulon positive regulatory protein